MKTFVKTGIPLHGLCMYIPYKTYMTIGSHMLNHAKMIISPRTMNR